MRNALAIMLIAFLVPRLASADPPAGVSYPFLEVENVTSLAEKFTPPGGFERVSVPKGSFAEWLRYLPLRTDRSDVHAFDGRQLHSPSAAIVAIDVGDRNLQQCADSAIRLHAEFLWSKGRQDALHYHFTSGDEVTFTDWVKGERVSANGSKVRRTQGPRRAADHASMRSWLNLVFMYAGTRSLHRDSDPVAPSDIHAGDFFVAPGSPGHAVVVLDIARSADGRRKALVGQGFMPAQDLHVVTSKTGVWLELPSTPTQTFITPSWQPFKGSEARRFRPLGTSPE